METPAELQTEWARLVIGGLVHGGVRDAVISPGSRSTPFTCAALQQRALNCTSAWDERSAAHFALGQARATGRPSLVICTSGSAGANYFPAVVEAFESGVPLVVLTADRPSELQGCGANQTTDQIEMFGRHVRFFANLGDPDPSDNALRAARRAALSAVEHAIGVPPGPVHLNAPARKPLEPAQSRSTALELTMRRVRESVAPNERVRVPRLTETELTELIELMANAERGLLLVGPLDPLHVGCGELALRAAQTFGFAVAAESPSQVRHFGGAGGAVLGAVDAIWRTARGREELRPDVVVQIGDAPTGPGWLEFRDTASDVRHVVVHPWKKADPTRGAERILHNEMRDTLWKLGEAGHTIGEVADTGGKVAGADGKVAGADGKVAEANPEDARPDGEDAGGDDEDARGDDDNEWLAKCMDFEARFWSCVESTLSSGDGALSEAAVAVEAMAALPDICALILGNSLPVRQVDMWSRPSDKRLTVFSQRGVSGIDGVLSGASGAAAKTNTPALAIIGDMSFLHDVGGLQLAALAERPFVVLVVNNRGGQIFRQLPTGEFEPAVLDYFTTPHQLELANASKLYGLPHVTVTERAALRTALTDAFQRNGCTVVEAIVSPTSADEQNKQLLAAVETSLQQV